MAVTSNMGLPIDQVSITPGPSWATDLEQTKLLLDVHTHVSGMGVPVPTAGLNINSSIPMGGYGLSNAGMLGLANQLTTSSGQVNFLFAYAGNLYWNQGSGVPIQLTTTTGINVSGVGGISGLTGTTGAWTYSAALTTFIGTADTNKSAAIDVGAVTVRETNVANSQGVTLRATPGLTSGYTLTLPSGQAQAAYPLSVTSSGAVFTSAQLRAFNQIAVTVPNGLGEAFRPIAGGYFGGVNQPHQSFLIPAGSIRPGSTIRTTVLGWSQMGTTTTGIWTIQMLAGSTGTASDGAIATRAFGSFNNVGSGQFRLDAAFTFRAINGAGNIVGGVHWNVQANNLAGIAPIQITSAYSGVQLNTTVDNYFTLVAQGNQTVPQQTSLLIDYGSMEIE